MLNLNEAIQRIKAAGANNVRIVPMDGQSALNGLHRIEVRGNPNWVGIIQGIPRSVAEDIVRQAVNKVILG